MGTTRATTTRDLSPVVYHHRRRRHHDDNRPGGDVELGRRRGETT
jgi:hypothetical protein